MITALVIAMAVAIGLLGGWVYAGFPLPSISRDERIEMPSVDLSYEELLQS